MRKDTITDGSAKYLQEYLELCENFIDGGFTRGEAEKKLVKLNKKYSKVVANKKIRKDHVIGYSLVSEDSWFPSDICY